jgi:predicted nucleic acid-binding protein
MSSLFIDTNIPMYAGGTPHALREPCQRIIAAVAARRLDAVTDTEVFQEILHRYFHIGERDKGLQIFDQFFRIMAGRILPVADGDVHQARELSELYHRLSPRDLLHVAIMLRHDIPELLTADRGFEAVDGIHRVDPAAFVPES